MKHKALRCSVIIAAGLFLAVFFGLAYKNTPQTDAVKATDFNAGRIIDDAVFYNPNTMTVAEIQAHLDRYSANCDMWGEQPIGYGRKINGVAVNPNISRREYARMMREAGRTDYHDAPYVCISKYYENPTTHKTNFETNAVAEEGMISAAQIIYDAAHAYNINPQVLLVMLKKESYVWGDTWPLKNEYNTVMGYACPDNAPCDSAYFGFYNQVMKAAWQLNYYKEHIYSYGYYPYMTNNIYYSPNYSCGTKSVYLENIATTSLYIYTPYTPNDAALANYPGEAYCGSYGNRNFFMYCSEWFGSTTLSQAKEIEDKLDSHAKEINFGEEIEDISCTTKNDQYYCRKRYAVGYIFYNNGDYKYLFGNSMNVWMQAKYLGVPISNEVYLDSNGIQWFENGAIAWTSEHGMTVIFGDIYKYWVSLGAEKSSLGLPISDENYVTPGYVTREFEHGTVYYNIKTGESTAIGDVFAETWASLGMDRSFLGRPNSMMTCSSSTACIQKFKGGTLTWTNENGSKVIFGGIHQEWTKTGAENGNLGLAISNEDYSTAGYAVQKFEHGSIFYNLTTGKASIINNAD